MKTFIQACAWALLFLLSAGPVAVQADTAPQLSLAQVLDRWAAALGGREQLAAIHGVHQVADIETGGLKGSFESWNDADGHLREATHIGDAVQETQILASDKGWVLDLSGTAHALSGTDLQELISEAYELSYSLLLPGRMQGKAELMGMDAARHAYMIKLQADGGQSVTVYLDAGSFLPQSETSVQDGQNQVLTYSAWHTVDGVQMPGQIKQSTGDPKYDVLLTFKSTEFNPPLDAALFSPPAGTAKAIAFDSSEHVVHLPFDLYGEHIYVQVGVNGSKPATFFFDTGAEASGIDSLFAKGLNIHSEGALEMGGAGGSDTMSMAKGLEFDLPGAQVPTNAVAVLPLSGLATIIGRPVVGILGFDVLSRFVVRIDYAAKQITLYEPAAFHDSGAGTLLPFTYQGNDIQVPVSILLPGKEAIATQANLDTGASSTELSSPFVDANGAIQSVGKTVERPSFGVGGSYAELDGRITGIQLGPYLMRSPVVGLSRAKQGTLSRADLGANIGNDILDHFTLTIDYPHQTLRLEPNARLDSPFDTDASGLLLLASGADFRTYTVYGVVPASPAAAAGILKGDEIVAVDGKPVAGYNRAELVQMFKQDGKHITLSIKRGGKHLDVSIALHDLV